MFTNGLGHKVAVYVPSTINTSRPLTSAEHDQHVQRTLRFFAGRFGGATAERAVGAWVDSDGDLVTEDVTIVYAYAAQLTTADLAAVRSYSQLLRDVLSQEAVAVEVDGELYFV